MIKNLHKKKLIGSVNNQLGVRKLKKKIIIYVGDEVFSGSAGTPRQTRQIENFLKTHNIILISRGKKFDVSDASLLKASQKIKRKAPRDYIWPKFKKVFRFLKNDLLFEYLTPRYLMNSLWVFICKQKNPGATVFYSSPSFPLFSFKPFIVDMRDPWALHPTLSYFTLHRELLEKFILRRATKVMVAGNFLRDLLVAKYNIHPPIVSYNYCDRSDYDYMPHHESELEQLDREFIEDVKSKYVYCYTGTLPENFYDIEKIKKVFAKLIINKKKVVFYIVGSDAKYRFAQTEDLNVKTRGNVSRKQAVTYQNYSNSLLLFGHRFDGYLTAKLFEYILTKKEIILIDWKKSSENEIINILESNGIRYKIF